MTEWLPSLNALRALEAVGRNQSYPRAAEELGVTPAAVKQLVAKLEGAFGQRLVVRNGRGIALTPAATCAQSDLAAAMQSLTNGVRKMRDFEAPQRLIVSVEASLATTWLVQRLPGFRKENPGIDVLIDSTQKIVDLKNSDVDVAIRYGVAPDPQLVTERLFDDRVFPACSPALAQELQQAAPSKHFTSAPLIHWDLSDQPWAKTTKKWFDWSEWATRHQIATMDTNSGLRFSDYGLAVQAAISGQGVILASWPILLDPLEAGLLVQPFPNYAERPGLGYDLVTTAASLEKPEVMAFKHWMMRVAAHLGSAKQTPTD
ncbi:LysR substrate-binding domain-containing protein [Algirhabdus cladophorae]|uniref:LysR substrate-binding domain-containing protein n=1 Tax=Algirhabdus cladophorae TaxID=3377108 RepID=UPI003B84A1E1